MNVASFHIHWVVIALAIATGAQGQAARTNVREQLSRYYDTTPVRFEIRGPDHQLMQEVPFVVTVMADVPPPVVSQLEKHFTDGIVPRGFTAIDVWPDAIRFQRDAGVHQIGQTRFGLYWSPLGTSAAWQTTMVLSGTGPRKITASPVFPASRAPVQLTVSAEPRWPASLTRAILLSLLVLVAAVLLVAPPRILPLVIIALLAAWMAWLAVPTTGDEDADFQRRVVAAAVPVILAMCTGVAIVTGVMKSPLLDLLLPVRQSGQLADEPPPDTVQKDEPRRRLPRLMWTPVPDPGNPALSAGRTAASAPAALAAPAPPLPAQTVLPEGARVEPTTGNAAGTPEDSSRPTAAPESTPSAPAAADARAAAISTSTAERILPDSTLINRYKDVADGIVSAAEHRAQWQLVLAGAMAIAALVFVLRATVTFGDAALMTPRSGESSFPLLVRVLPYLLCFTTLLFAAGFLLRQYRASLDDFRHFVRGQRLRESQLAALAAARLITNPDEVARKTIEILAWGESGGGKEAANRDSLGSKDASGTT